MVLGLVNDRDLQFEYTRVLNESLLVPVVMYGSETMIWNKDRSNIRGAQMDILRGLLGIRI